MRITVNSIGIKILKNKMKIKNTWKNSFPILAGYYAEYKFIWGPRETERLNG